MFGGSERFVQHQMMLCSHVVDLADTVDLSFAVSHKQILCRPPSQGRFRAPGG